MVLEKETFDKYGYSAASLVKGSHAKVVCKCDISGKIFDKVRRNVKDINSTIFPAELRKSFYMKKYGVENVSQLEATKLQKEQTCLAKYGVTNAFKSEEIKRKIEKHNLDKYGVTHHLKSIEGMDKLRATNLEKYGCEYSWQNENVKAKILASNITKYGEAHVAQRLAKATTTNQSRYSVDTPFESKLIRSKGIATLQTNYNVVNPSLSKEICLKREATCLTKYQVANPFSHATFKLKAANTKMKRYGTLSPNQHLGKTQKEIEEWLNSFGYNFKSNVSLLENGKEIDMYDDTLKLGIEYCGLHWHHENSPQPRPSGYHSDKYHVCLAKGVRLITIFEDEWLNRQDQVKNFIKSVIRKNSRNLYARKCTVQSINKAIGSEFIQKYHIQGANSLGKYFAGLYYKEELVGVMSFGKHHRNTAITTLDRLCFKDDVSVAGGASRLFKLLIREYNIKEIISWSDNRWSQGAVYEALGFKLAAILPPDYSYASVHKQGVRYSKQSQKKSNVKCPDGLTELQWANERGLSRIWDCGKRRWRFPQ